MILYLALGGFVVEVVGMDSMTSVVLYSQIISASFAISMAIYGGNQILRKARARGRIDVDDAAAAVVVAVLILADLGGIWAITRIP